VIIANADGIKVGDKLSVTVTGSDEYDLFAVPAVVPKVATPVVAATAG